MNQSESEKFSSLAQGTGSYPPSCHGWHRTTRPTASVPPLSRASSATGTNVPTGANLTVPTHTVLTVGSDCALGKMTVCLELDREARPREARPHEHLPRDLDDRDQPKAYDW